MEMSPEEIVRDYRTAKNKGKQVTILAELNGCTREDIIAVLSAGGINPKELPRSRKKANVVPGGGSAGSLQYFRARDKNTFRAPGNYICCAG